MVWLQLFFPLGLLVLLAWPLGEYMARVYAGERTALTGLLGGLERRLLAWMGVRADEECGWKAYARGVLALNALGFAVVYALQRLQAGLPLDPSGAGPVSPHSAFNTALSFVTNTNWQSYAGETTLAHLTQMLGLTVQNFLSAATGMAVLVAVIRGFARHESATVGCFWVDLVRSVVHVLLPLSVLLALALVGCGVVQTLSGSAVVHPLDPEAALQHLPLGPVASQVAIKQLGTNGGGFFNANSAHPFENPSALSCLLETLAILLIPAALCATFGALVGDRRQGAALLATMLLVLVPCVGAVYACERAGTPALAEAGAAPDVGNLGGNLEGKELRFGLPQSALWVAATSAASNGSVNAMHDSLTPLGGLVPLVLILLGEVIFGGVGSGLYGLLCFAIVAVFVAGLLVGRTPEYLGKKIGAYEMKMAVLVILAPCFAVLGGAALAAALPAGRAGVGNPGPHGFSEILYAFGSAGNNNGSAFAGLAAGTAFYDTALGLAMLVGRYATMLPVLGLAGALARRKSVPVGAGTLPSHTPFFVALLLGTLLLVGALTYLPALSARADRGTAAERLRRGGWTVSQAGRSRALFDRALLLRACVDAVHKLDPRVQVRNPVLFVVWVGALLTSALGIAALVGRGEEPFLFSAAVAAWLWATVLLANLAEALAEGRGKAQARALRSARQDVVAKRIPTADSRDYERVPAPELTLGELVWVEAGDTIPCDGEVVAGIASVDESAITGESAPVIRESGGDRSAVTGGTRVLSDGIAVRVTARQGDTFLDRMIALVEGAKRRRTPNEIALAILLAALTLVFLLATLTLRPFSAFAVVASGQGQAVSIPVLVALLVCLIPTTIGGLLSAIGIAGMDRMIRANVIARSGRAVEAAGDVDVLLLDKTGTITLGNRQATELLPAKDVPIELLADCVQLASLADETPEGRSIVVLAKERHGLRERNVRELGARFVPFSAQTRMSGVDLDGREIRKGSVDRIAGYVGRHGGSLGKDVEALVREVGESGGTPLVVAERERVLGVVRLKDIVKGGIRERFQELRRMGIRTIMITGDNALTAAAIAAEAGVDDFLAEATPETKLELIRDWQRRGHMVAMAGDGTNDAPALAQADVAVAMNTGTQAAREAGNLIDLDSNPTKLIEIVSIGKQLLMTRGALTTFSLANDVAKYFAILPAAFAPIYPALRALDVMHLSTPRSAVLSAVIFNALVIVFLVPLALRGVRYRPLGAAALLRRNLLVFGLGGLIVPFLGIKAIDLCLGHLHLV